MKYPVSGIFRSGTSMMMGLLNDGGVPITWSESREWAMRSEDTEEYQRNKYGFWEVGQKAYMQLGFSDTVPEGNAVKIQAVGIPLLTHNHYKVILMRRHPEEIRDSYKRAFPKDKESPVDRPDWESYYYKLMHYTKDIMDARSDIEYIEVWMRDVIENPLKEANRLVDFGIPIDPEKAIIQVDPAQYRYKAV